MSRDRTLGFYGERSRAQDAGIIGVWNRPDLALLEPVNAETSNAPTAQNNYGKSTSHPWQSVMDSDGRNAQKERKAGALTECGNNEPVKRSAESSGSPPLRISAK